MLEVDSIESLFAYYPQNRYLPLRQESCVHVSIRQTALRCPDVEAVCSHDGTFTYKELNDNADSLAQKLINASVTVGSIVPISFEHSRWAIVAMLGLLKAGCHFCPIPDSPSSRIETMLKQMPKTQLILTSRKNYSNVSKHHRNVWSVPFPEEEESAPRVPPLPNVSPSDLAYIVFTSGSTGVPKGVQIEHSQLSSFVHKYIQTFSVDRSTRSLQYSAYTFDGCMMEIMTTLVAGGCVCIPSEEDRFGHLPSVIQSFQVTHAFLVPSVLQSVWPDKLDLKCLLIGGEQSTPESLQRWLGPQDLKIYHVYGPTECCVLSSALPIEQETVFGASTSIGDLGYASLLGLSMWIVDPEDPDILLPPGDNGEILIEGPSVARGYSNNPSASQSNFISQPRWLKGHRESPGRLYRSGDIGCCMPDGSIQYIGRKDTQIKLDGQRVELGDIETHLRRLLENQPEAVVDLIQPDEESRKQLVCFVVDRQTTSKEELKASIMTAEGAENVRRQLEGKMPHHMIPSTFIMLSSMPKLVSSLKIDRKMLKATAISCIMEARRVMSKTVNDHVLYSSEKEKAMHQLWASTLKVPISTISMNANFFQLGGTSASAMELISRARKRGLALTIKLVFDNPSVKAMADVAAMEEQKAVSDPPPFSLLANDMPQDIVAQVAIMCGVTTGEVQDVYPVSDFLEILMSSTETEALKGLWKTSEVFKVPAHVTAEQYVNAWKQIISNFDICRTRVMKINERLLEVVLKRPVEVGKGGNLQEKLRTEAQRPMGYGDPLNYFTVANEGSQDYFIWTSKNLFDGETLNNVVLLLDRVLKGAELEQPAKITHLIRHRLSADMSESIAFFKAQFAGSNIRRPFQIPENYMAWVNNITERETRLEFNNVRFTLSTCISVAVAIVLSQFYGHDDLCFSTIRSGRMMPVPRIVDYIGRVVEAIHLRFTVPIDATLHQLLQTYQDNWAQSVPHEILGMKRIVAISDECRDAVMNDVSLNIQSDPTIPSVEGFEHYEVQHFDLPFAAVFECHLRKDGFLMKLFHDEAIIAPDLGRRLLEKVDVVTHRLAQADDVDTLQALVDAELVDCS